MKQKPKTIISTWDKIKLALFPLIPLTDNPTVRQYLNELYEIRQQENDSKIVSMQVKKVL